MLIAESAYDLGQTTSCWLQADHHLRFLSLWLCSWSATAYTPFLRFILRNPLDLPYLYSTKGKIKELLIAQESAEGSKGKLTSYAQRGAGWLVGGGIDLFRTNIAGAQRVDRYIKRVRAIPDVVSTLLSWNVPFDLPL